MNIQKMKELNMDRVLDDAEAMALSADFRTLENEYGHQEKPVPEWIEKGATVLREEIARRDRAADIARLKDLEHELEGYKTVSEKRNEAQRSLAALQKKLGLSEAKAGR